MPLVTRTGKGSKLTIAEMDGNLEYLYSGSFNTITSPQEGDTLVYSSGSWIAQTGPLTTIVNIDSGSILNMGSSPIELLPAPGAGKYYEYSGYIEFNGGTTGYTVTDDIVIGSVTKYGGSYLSTNLIAGTDDVVMGFSNLGGGQQVGVNAGVVVSVEQPLNEAISLFTYNQTDPTLGDGTLRVIITYTTRTFGS